MYNWTKPYHGVTHYKREGSTILSDAWGTVNIFPNGSGTAIIYRPTYDKRINPSKTLFFDSAEVAKKCVEKSITSGKNYEQF